MSTHLSSESLCLRARRWCKLKLCVKLCVFRLFFRAGSETALAEVTLNILCLLMRNQWSWLCTQNMQNTIRMLFGTLINR